MTEVLTIRVIHEWRPGHADPLARIERIALIMVDITQRLTDSVTNLVTAIQTNGQAVSDVAAAVRNHPAATADGGKLANLADQLDAAAQSLGSATTALRGLADEENASDAGAGGGQTTPVTEPAAGGSDTTSGPPAGDGTAGAGADAGSSAGGDAGVPSGTTDAVPPADGASPPADGTQTPPDTDTGVA